MKNIFERTKGFSFDKNRNKQFGVKSAIVWAESSQVNGIYPALYISKPKNITQEDYELMLDRLELHFKVSR